jgi:eight-cysteine-cluster-containing protein
MRSPLKMFWSACFISALVSLSACACKGPAKTETPDVGNNPSAESSTGLTGAGCMRTGCSAQLCAAEGESVMSTCIWKDEYACYQSAKCEKQKDGNCGWTQTDELNACLTSSRTK